MKTSSDNSYVELSWRRTVTYEPEIKKGLIVCLHLYRNGLEHHLI